MNEKYNYVSRLLNEKIKASTALKFGAAGLPLIGAGLVVPASLYKSHKFNKQQKPKTKSHTSD